MLLKELLKEMVNREATDLHIKIHTSPAMRVYGKLLILQEYPPISEDNIEEIFNMITTEEQRERFAEELELDITYSLEDVGRFRINIYQAKGTKGFVFRLIPPKIRSIEELLLPVSITKQLAEKPHGLVLITGPTGCGKSTTLAAMIEYINQKAHKHIVTIEDPIEYVFTDKKSIINQRELGKDTKSFAEALRHVLRQDPDIIMVGEMRDLETISLTIMAAETGHLVLSTMHTSGAAACIDRLVNAFPGHLREQVRVQVANTLEGVLYQQLLPREGAVGRIVATEVLVGTTAVKNLIRENRTHQLGTLMHSGAQFGMQTMEQALKMRFQANEISYTTALAAAPDPETFKKLVGR